MKIKLYSFFIGLFFALSLSIEGEVWTDCSQAFEPVEIAAQTVTLPSPATIDYKAGLWKEFREALADRKDINWNAVADNYREWSEHTTTLSGPARMLVACVLTVVTNGMGTEWLAAHGIAEGTAMNAALSAGIQAVTVSAGTSFAGNLGDIGKTFDELTSGDFVKSLASTMLTAGISQSLSTSLKLPDEPKTFTDALKANAVHGLVRTGVDSAITGGSVTENLAQNMTCAVVDAGAAQIAHKIGDAKATGKLDKFTHKVVHAGAGAVSQALTGRDPVAGAIGAAVSEIAAESLHKDGKDPATTAKQARIIGDTVAFVAGRDVTSADEIGSNAVENNWLMHPELQIIRQKIIDDKNLSDEEKQQRLAEVTDFGKSLYQAEGLGAVIGLTGTVTVAAVPAIYNATLASSAYLLTNPQGMKVASFAKKTATTLGTGFVGFHYGQKAIKQGPDAAWHAMKEDAGLALTMPPTLLTKAAKTAFSVPHKANAIKTVPQEIQPVVKELAPTIHRTESLLATTEGTTKSIAKTGPPVKNIGRLIPHNGTVINGRYYTKHALERMAPDTLEFRAELTSLTAKKLAKQYTPGSEEFLRELNKNIQPRGIPPSVVENAIQNGQRSVDPIEGRIHCYDPINNVTVVTDSEDKVIVTVLKGKIEK